MKLIETGWYHVLAVKENGELFGIGDNTNGQLGLGDKTTRSEWTKVSAFDGMDVCLVQCGENCSAVLTNEGLYVMGRGLVDFFTHVTTPTRVELDGVVDISLRSRFDNFSVVFYVVELI